MSNTSSRTDTYNSDDILRVFASFAADYKMVAEWTKLSSREYVDETTLQIKALAENEYLDSVHLQLVTTAGRIPEAVVYRVSTNASTWVAERPATLKWSVGDGDSLKVIVYFSQKWTDLPDDKKREFSRLHLPNWVDSNFSGKYEGMAEVGSTKFASRGYGLERTQMSST